MIIQEMVGEKGGGKREREKTCIFTCPVFSIVVNVTLF